MKTAPPAAQAREPTDEQLMLRVQHGERAAYDQLYTRWGARVFGFLCRRTGAREQAQEAHQETWLNVYRFRQGFDPRRRFRPWLFAIAANAGRDSMRPQPALFRLPVLPGEPQDIRDQLVSALHVLSGEDRRILLLIGEGFTAGEVGEMLSLRAAAVRKRVSRARRRIRETTHAA